MGKVLAYTEPDRPRPVPTGRGPASTTEEDTTAAALPQRMHLPGLLKVEQASALMGISRSAAYRAVAAGDLPSVRLDAGSMCRPHGCSSCWAWFWRTADAERLDSQARQHLDLVHRGRAGPEHRPAPPSLQGRL